MATVSRCWENKLNYPVLLSEVLDWCLREHKVDTLLATASRSIGQGRASYDPLVDRAAKSIFGGHLIKRFSATGWPGTEKTRHSGRIYVVRFDKVVRNRMVMLADDLFEWKHWPRQLPEDICVFRGGSRFPVLLSVTHEEDAWIISDKKASPPGFKKSSIKPEELFIWDGPFFCRI